ncbi:MAG: PVC-type heme-binding CxxCH protein, partial [Pirellulales bacterium]
MRLLTVAIVASAIAVSAIAASVGHAADGNRLTYLDVDDPYYVSASFPKLTSPMLVGDGSVDAILVLSIDDMRDAATYERFLRPTLDRLKQIDGRAPVSISACSIDPSEPHLQRWLKEGLSFEVHTVDHPCPLLSDGDFAKARSTVDRCIDNLFRIPNARPVAYRGPCSDIWNTHSPRFFTEILNKTTSAGNFLKFDSTVHHIFTKDDPEIPKAMLIDEAGRERFAKFTSGIVPIFGRHNYKYANYVANYPYPYVVSRLCWEIPIQMPGDHQAASYEPAFGHRTLTEWKAAIDVTVVKRGLMTLAFHPYGKTSNEDLLGLIDHVVDRYGKKVKFLSLRDVDELLIRNVLGGQALRASNGQDNGVRVLDVNDDGFIDVVIGNEHTRQTRIWSPKSGKWIVSGFPVMLVQVAPDGTRRDAGARFGVIDKSGLPVVIVRNESTAAAYAFDGERWVSRPDLLVGLQIDGKHVLTNADRRDRGVRLRDLNGDGVCELLVGNESQSAVFAWRAGDKRWRRLPFGLPERTAIVDSQGRDAGMRFVDLNEDSQEAGRNGARADVLFSNESHYVAARFVSLDEGFGKPVAEGQHGEGEPIPQIVADGQNNGAWLHSGRLWVTNETTDALPNHTQSVLLRDIGKPAASPPAAAPLKPKVVPHNAPAKVTADGDGALRLLAANAELYGREGPGTIAVYDAQMCIGWWKDENDYAVWTVDAPRAGRYDVFLHWSIPDPMAGNLVALEVGPHRLVASVPSTGGFEHFRLAKFGTTWLEKGPNRVKLRPLGPIKGELADLKEIRLTAVDDAVPGIPAGGTTPEQTVAGLSVPEGFEVNVFAAEPWVSNPTSICVDTKGRIWVTESSIYRHPGGTLRPDRIKVFEDVDGDGRADRATVFFEGLMSPMSLAVAGDRVYVAESPFLYVFEDRNGDLKADGPPRKLLTGFGGFNDDQSLHGLALGPDHKLYLTMGDLSFDVTGPDGIHVSHDVGAVLRCEMDGTKLEVIARDLKNPIEVAVNSFGDAWFSGNDDDGTRMTRLDYALEGGNYGWRYWGVYGERRKVFGSGPEAHWHTNVIGVVPPILMTGFGAPCGKAFIEHGMFGEAYRNTLFHADPGPRELRAYHFTQSGAAFAARRETVVGGDEDTYFRPVDVAVANDGVLYFCDWYDQGIGGHAYNDRWRGRIYSLRRKGDGHRRIGTPGPFSSIDDALVSLANPYFDTQFLA